MVNLEKALWDSGTVEAVSMMNKGFSGDTSSLFNEAKERERVLNPMKHLFATGALPPTIALLSVGEGYEVADGHHRLLALFQSRTIAELLVTLEAEGKKAELEAFYSGFKNQWGITELATIPTHHEVWVARHNKN